MPSPDNSIHYAGSVLRGAHEGQKIKSTASRIRLKFTVVRIPKQRNNAISPHIDDDRTEDYRWSHDENGWIPFDDDLSRMLVYIRIGYLYGIRFAVVTSPDHPGPYYKEAISSRFENIGIDRQALFLERLKGRALDYFRKEANARS